MKESKSLADIRSDLVDVGGRTSQDLGLGRIVGQILVYLYLKPDPCPLDELEKDLGLSKASVSIAARQLEQLRLVQRVWVKGERKKYYRSADNIGSALQQGILSVVRKKVSDFGTQLDESIQSLDRIETLESAEAVFLKNRIIRADRLQRRVDKLLGNPLVKLLNRAID